MKLFSYVQQLLIRRKYLFFIAAFILSIFIISTTSVHAYEITSSSQQPDVNKAEELPILTLELNFNQFIFVQEYMSLIENRYNVTDISIVDSEGKALPDNAKVMDGFHVFHDRVEYMLKIIYRTEGTPEKEPIIIFPSENNPIDETITKLPQLEMTVTPYGMTVEEFKKSFHIEDIAIIDENGEIVGDEALIETGMHVFIDGVEYVLIVNVATSEIVKGTTVGQHILSLIERGYQSIVIKDSDRNIITDESVVMQGGFIIEVDLEITVVKIVPPTYLIVLDDGKESITVGEWKELNPTKVIVVKDEIGNVVADELVIVNGYIAMIDGEEFRLVVDNNESHLKSSSPPVEIIQYPAEPSPEPSQEELDRIAREKEVAKKKAEQEAKVKAEARAKIIAVIKAKADARIKAEQLAEAKTLMKIAVIAQKQMDQKLETWQDAKKELLTVNKTANAIKLVKGKPDLTQVGNALGQYQAIANRFFKEKKYSDVVITVSHATVVFMIKKVDQNVILDFVKENIHTSKNMQIIINDLKKQKLDVTEFEEYKNELKEKETPKKASHYKME